MVAEPSPLKLSGGVGVTLAPIGLSPTYALDGPLSLRVRADSVSCPSDVPSGTLLFCLQLEKVLNF